MTKPPALRVFRRLRRLMLPRDAARGDEGEALATAARLATDARAHGPVALCRYWMAELTALLAAAITLRHPEHQLPDDAFPDRRRPRMLSALTQDIRYAIRLLRRSPAYTTVAVVTLALGFAGPTVMFAMAKQWILDPLPFADPDRLIDIRNRDTVSGQWGPMNVADFLDARRNADSADLAAYRRSDLRLTGADRAERIAAAETTAEFFELLGTDVTLGRVYATGDDDPARSRVAVISASMWRRHFAGDPAVVGGRLRLDGEDHAVIGVLPEAFQFTLLGSVDVWRPLVITADDATNRNMRSVTGLGRLRAGRTIEQAGAELTEHAERLAAAHPETNARRAVRVVSLAEEIRLHHDAGVVVPVMFAMMCCVLLVACVNVMNMTLARARTRRQEVAVRLALGASRARIVRQWVVEHTILFVAASAIGAVLAVYGAAWVTDSIPPENRQFLRNHAVLTVDATIVAFALAVGLMTGVVVGWLAARASVRADVGSDLRDASARATVGRAGARLRGMLVAAEVAFALALLISAGLLIATARNVTRADVGFDPRDLLTFNLSLDPHQYSEPAVTHAFYARLLARLQGIPGVQHAAVGSVVPFGDSGGRTEFFVDAQAETPPAETPQAVLSAVTPAYGRTLGLRRLDGRLLEAHDAADAPKVVVINETLASRYLGGRDPLGARLRFGRRSTDVWTVVGVVADVRYFETRDSKEPQAYLPFAQSSRRDATVVLRAHAPAEMIARQARAAVAEIDSREPLVDFTTMQARIHRETAAYETISAFVMFFGVVTLFLAGVGVYGVVSYTFAQRTREIGIRMALGARRSDIAGLVLAQARLLLAGGIVPGLALAWVLGQTMKAILFGVTATDWRLYAGMTLLLTVVAMAALGVPARPATRIDPVVALRAE
jgi:putative ABC transport system permease protein